MRLKNSVNDVSVQIAFSVRTVSSAIACPSAANIFCF